jgi:hypothetical protein
LIKAIEAPFEAFLNLGDFGLCLQYLELLQPYQLLCILILALFRGELLLYPHVIPEPVANIAPNQVVPSAGNEFPIVAGVIRPRSEVLGTVIVNSVLASIPPHHHRLATLRAEDATAKERLDALALLASAPPSLSSAGIGLFP